MEKVIGVRFRNAGKVYYFSPGKTIPCCCQRCIPPESASYPAYACESSPNRYGRPPSPSADWPPLCGRSLCCHTHLSEFIPVSIKMAKEQNLSLNPTKISGVCGRLMCCLKGLNHLGALHFLSSHYHIAVLHPSGCLYNYMLSQPHQDFRRLRQADVLFKA